MSDTMRMKTSAANLIGMLRTCPVERNDKIPMPGGWVEVKLELPFIIVREIEKNSESPEQALTFMCRSMLHGIASRLEKSIFKSEEEFKEVMLRATIKAKEYTAGLGVSSLEDLTKMAEGLLEKEIKQDVEEDAKGDVS